MRASAWLFVLAVLSVAGYAWWHFAPQTLPAGIRGPTRAPENPALFKWRDANGQWHITDSPPTQGEYEKIVVDPNTNVVPSTVPVGDDAEAPRQ